MKRKTILWALMGAVLGMTFASCSDSSNEEEDTTKAVAVTGEAYDVTMWTANIRGYANLNLLNGNTTTEYRIGIQWEETTEEEFYRPKYKQADGLTGNEFSVTLYELTPNTQYIYRTFVYANGIYHYGETKKFRTTAIPQVATAGKARNITATTAEVEVKIDMKKVKDGPLRDLDFTVGVAFSADRKNLEVEQTEYLNAIKSTCWKYRGGETTTTPSDALAYNLLAGTEYYYAVYTEWDGIYVLGEPMSFTTKEVRQIASVGEAKEVGTTSAEIEVTIDTTRMSQVAADRANHTAGVAYSTKREDLSVGGSYVRCQTFRGRDMYETSKPEFKSRYKMENLAEATTYYYCAYTSAGGQEVLGEVKSFTTVERPLPETAPLLFKEIFGAGGKAGYTQDTYFEIVNNSNEVQYLDQLVLLYASGGQKTKNPWQANGVTDIYYQDQGAVVAFPGSGKDHPIEPGQSVVIANDATNHQAADPDGIHSDLSKADWEIYLEYSRLGDTDYNAPNLYPIYRNNEYLRAFGLGFFNGVYILAKLPVNPDTYAARSSSYSTVPGSSGETKYMGIRREYVIDAVEAWDRDEYEHYPYLHSEDDAHPVWAPEAFSGKCLRRKSVEVKGRRYYQDTNNSYDDFLTDQPQQPGK